MEALSARLSVNCYLAALCEPSGVHARGNSFLGCSRDIVRCAPVALGSRGISSHGGMHMQPRVVASHSVPIGPLEPRNGHSHVAEHGWTQAHGKPTRKGFVEIYDSTLRDGAQMVGLSLTSSDKRKIAMELIKLGVAYIEGGWPGSNPKDAEFFTTYPQYCPPDGPKLAAFGSTRHKNKTCEQDGNIQALVASGAPVITLFAKTWDMQVTEILETTLDNNLRMIRDSVSYFARLGREVMLDAEHFFDGYSANPDYAIACLRTAAEAGASTVVLCDTNGGSLPWNVEEAVRRVVAAMPHSAGGPVRVGIHTHNDCEMAVANSVAAVHAGATLVQGCMNGYGERTGNANLVSVIGTLHLKMGHPCLPESSLASLSAISEAIAAIADQPWLPSMPFVGANAFAHKGGVHVSAIRKNPRSYNHIDPTLVGNGMTSVLSELSGRANVLDSAQRSGFEIDQVTAGSVLSRIKQLENEGCAFEGASASVSLMILRRMDKYVRKFHVLEYSVVSSNRDAESIGSVEETSSTANVNQAIVKIETRDGARPSLHAAEGNGPVDALWKALYAGLRPRYAQLDHVRIADYSVRLLEVGAGGNAEGGSMSTTRVTIKFQSSGGGTWSTVGAHTSIVESSFRALIDGLEFAVLYCGADGTLRGPEVSKDSELMALN